jgi:hypothetical protein
VSVAFGKGQLAYFVIIGGYFRLPGNKRQNCAAWSIKVAAIELRGRALDTRWPGQRVERGAAPVVDGAQSSP